jgi:hypothetical protein
MKREIALPPTPAPTIQPIIIPGTMENQQNNMTSIMTPATFENQQYMATANQLQAYNWPQSYAFTQQPLSGNRAYPQF